MITMMSNTTAFTFQKPGAVQYTPIEVSTNVDAPPTSGNQGKSAGKKYSRSRSG